MIMEDDIELDLEILFKNIGSLVKPSSKREKGQAFLEMYQEIENGETYTQLRDDLI
jgi:hypothetical protein